jgi:hypothetical protein
MKSIHTALPKGIDVFTDEVKAFISNERFEFVSRDTYNKEVIGEKLYRIHIDLGGTFILNVYIGSNGIAIDKDYDCGGNSSTEFFSFYAADAEFVQTEEFELTYDQVVDRICELKN